MKFLEQNKTRYKVGVKERGGHEGEHRERGVAYQSVVVKEKYIQEENALLCLPLVEKESAFSSLE